MAGFADLEVRLQRRGVDTYDVGLRFTQADSDDEKDLTLDEPAWVRFDFIQLRELAADVERYGVALSRSLFSGRVGAVFGDARKSAEAADATLRVRLFIPASAPELHSIRWETLRDPANGDPLFTSERILFSRYLTSDDWRRVQRRSKGELRTLLMIANPTGLDSIRPGGRSLCPVDLGAELDRARAGLMSFQGAREPDVLRSPGAMLERLCERLRDGCDLLYLVCHGALIDDEPILYLESEAGGVAPVEGCHLLTWLRELTQLPRLVVLASCQSAGAGEESSSRDRGALAALGPRLAAAGVPAIVAMQGDVTMVTVEQFMPAFFRELGVDGQIDRAMAVARSKVRDRWDHWMPVLFMRLKSGQLWYAPGIGDRSADFFRWRPLLTSIREGKCVPILGPGLTEALLGLRREIARRLARRSEVPLILHERVDLPQVAQVVAIDQGSTDYVASTLLDQLREEIMARLRSDEPPMPSDATLNELVVDYVTKRQFGGSRDSFGVLARLPFRIFITTQPTDLLTESLRRAGKEPRVAISPWSNLAEVDDLEEGYVPDEQHPLVYHAFGHVDQRETLVLTEDDYFNYLIRRNRDNSRVSKMVDGALARSALLFLGFQVDDWNFRVLFHSIMNQPGAEARSRFVHVAVQVEPDEGDILRPDRARKYLESYFGGYQDQRRNVSVYWGSSEDFIAELLEQPDAQGILRTIEGLR
jgi:hypothetical protein